MRKRELSPEFFADDKIVTISPESRLFYQGLWLYADDEGFFEEEVNRIKLAICPYSNLSIETELYELVKIGFLEAYELKEKVYYRIKNFLKWQTVSHPTPSKIACILEASGILKSSPTDPYTLIYNNTYKSNKNSSKYVDKDAIRIFNYWNSKKIVRHKEIGPHIRSIKAKLKPNAYKVNEVEGAIDNYAEALNSDKTWLDYRWGLSTFLKQSNAFEKFTKENFHMKQYIKKEYIKDYEKKKLNEELDK